MISGKKKKRKIGRLVACIVLLLVVAVAYVPVSSYISGRLMPAAEAALPAASTEQTTLAEITDDELDKLISGEVSLDDLLSGSGEQDAASSAQSGGEAAAGDTETASSSSSTTAVSGSTASSAASASSSTGTSTSSSSSSSSGSAGTSKSTSTTSASSSSSASTSGSGESSASYEAELKALIQQLYGVQARAESGLNSCIASARAEYKALPAEQQTQAKKIAICFSKAGQLSSLQASCDKEVESIVSQMRQVLTENGQSTALADQAMATYKSKKSARYNELMAQLYS